MFARCNLTQQPFHDKWEKIIGLDLSPGDMDGSLLKWAQIICVPLERGAGIKVADVMSAATNLKVPASSPWALTSTRHRVNIEPLVY